MIDWTEIVRQIQAMERHYVLVHNPADTTNVTTAVALVKDELRLGDRITVELRPNQHVPAGQVFVMDADRLRLPL